MVIPVSNYEALTLITFSLLLLLNNVVTPHQIKRNIIEMQSTEWFKTNTKEKLK